MAGISMEKFDVKGVMSLGAAVFGDPSASAIKSLGIQATASAEPQVARSSVEMKLDI
ncbi:MAG: hypothetical protein RBR86_09900 [Pseudobdellovibrionaceae bacterium]|nr:hypothetical protein [Pseudobdellovibrionaceae bacterium]